MNELQIIQNQFIDGVYDKRKKQILSAIKNGKAPKEELFDIYRGNMQGMLFGVLKITYPQVFEFLKEKKFKEFVLEFIASNRSQSGNLDEYGESFYKLLQRKKEYFLSDLARLEWLKQRAYLAADANKLDIKKLQNLSEEKLFSVKFDLHPSLCLMTSRYNLLSAKKQNKALKKPAHFVIYRHDLDIVVNKVSEKEFNFIKAIQENHSLYEVFTKHKPDIGSCLSNNLSNGLITGFRT